MSPALLFSAAAPCHGGQALGAIRAWELPLGRGGFGSADVIRASEMSYFLCERDCGLTTAQWTLQTPSGSSLNPAI